MASYTTRTTCRSCGGAGLTELFSLGEQFVSDFVPGPVLNSPPREEGDAGRSESRSVQAPVKVPITLDLCRACTLVQARHSPPADLLYRRHYHYRSGVTDTMRAALADVVDAARRAVDLKPGDVVLDIGSNDGTLLRCYAGHMAPDLIRIGCEPAFNLNGPENYEAHSLRCIRDFWSFSSYMLKAPGITRDGGTNFAKIRSAKIVTACGMLYDLEDPNQFVADVAKVLHPEGVFVAQLMCLRQMVRQKDVGNLAHEHLEFYTLESLVRLFARNGLEVYDVEENDVNGGSYRIFARRLTVEKAGVGAMASLSQVVAKALHAEKRLSLGSAAAAEEEMRLWWLDVQEAKEILVSFLRREIAAGKRVWVLGASTKGNALLQWWGLDSSVIDAAADRDPAKNGKWTVGSGIHIVSEADFRASAPDYALVLPYAFLSEIFAREEVWLRSGGQMVVPLPKPRRVWLEGGERKEAPL